ncbi:MAG TPA: manganese efflux pump [Candidatus Eisenbergiella merdipullorum]|uniref:Manganese efflux pump n=1 Tax=Candidatus Eisenbergiella merdipullorum TaxID=2838553 RepID=A0A9D2I4P9_9FIRM|nr:manganese efflux pump [Candidatus Eisenbergiella merdipullorum]
MLQAFLFCLALCTDTFMAGIAYGADGIRIGWKKMGLMNAIGSACLGAALCLGTLIRGLVPDAAVRSVAFVSLLFLGCVRLFDSLIKNYINHHCDLQKDIHFSFSRLRFILSIYANPAEADEDKNRVLSMREAVFFGFAMSIDSLAAGTFAAFWQIPPLFTLFLSFLFGMAAMAAGQRIGKGIAARFRWDFSWVSGLFFLSLAFLRLIR